MERSGIESFGRGDVVGKKNDNIEHKLDASRDETITAKIECAKGKY